MLGLLFCIPSVCYIDLSSDCSFCSFPPKKFSDELHSFSSQSPSGTSSSELLINCSLIGVRPHETKAFHCLYKHEATRWADIVRDALYFPYGEAQQKLLKGPLNTATFVHFLKRNVLDKSYELHAEAAGAGAEDVEVEVIDFDSFSAIIPPDSAACGVVFLGRGNGKGIESVSLLEMRDLGKRYGATLLGFFGCHLGSSRNVDTLIATQSRQWESMFGIGFDQKVTLSMIEESGVLECMSTVLRHAVVCGEIVAGRNHHEHNRDVMRYAIACKKLLNDSSLNRFLFFNDADARNTSFEKAVDIYEDVVVDCFPNLCYSYLDLIQYHMWSVNGKGEEVILEFLNGISKSMSPNDLESKIMNLIVTIGLEYIYPDLKKVWERELSRSVILEVCGGNWKSIDADELALALSRGYRGSSTFMEAVNWAYYLLNIAVDEDTYKFRALCLMGCDSCALLGGNWDIYRRENGEARLICTINERSDFQMIHDKFNPVNESDLLHFSSYYCHMKDRREKWVNLFNRAQEDSFIILGDMLSLNASDLQDRYSQKEAAAFVEVQYSQEVFKNALYSLRDFVLNDVNVKAAFDSKVFEEGGRLHGTMFPRLDDQDNLVNKLKYAESNVITKIGDVNKNLNRCRFVYIYVKKDYGGEVKCYGRLFYTDVHYGSFLCYKQEKSDGNVYSNDELDKKPSHEILKLALSIAEQHEIHPFEYCGILSMSTLGHSHTSLTRYQNNFIRPFTLFKCIERPVPLNPRLYIVYLQDDQKEAATKWAGIVRCADYFAYNAAKQSQFKALKEEGDTQKINHFLTIQLNNAAGLDNICVEVIDSKKFVRNASSGAMACVVIFVGNFSENNSKGNKKGKSGRRSESVSLDQMILLGQKYDATVLVWLGNDLGQRQLGWMFGIGCGCNTIEKSGVLECMSTVLRNAVVCGEFVAGRNHHEHNRDVVRYAIDCNKISQEKTFDDVLFYSNDA